MEEWIYEGISICRGTGCPNKKFCYRYTTPQDKDNHYEDYYKNPNGCKYFVKNKSYWESLSEEQAHEEYLKILDTNKL